MIYIVRHGETDWNKEHRVQGHQDIPLNEQGIKDAYVVKEKLKDINFDMVFSSPLQRAYETAKIITDKPVTIDNRLIERYNGKLEGCNDVDLLYKVDWNDENSIYGLERISDLYGRVKSFFDEIKEKYKGKDILVVTHAGIGIQIRLYFEGPLPEGEKATFYRIGNGEVLIYDNN